MTLLALPTEIIQLIGDQLDDAGLNALIQAHRHMHQLLNGCLYRRDVIKPYSTSRSLAWATWDSTSSEATARKDTVLCAIEAGRHLKQVPDNFHTALALAASDGYAHIVKALLTLDGINPNFGGRFAPPLILATKRGPSHCAIVKMLLAAVNIDPNVRDIFGSTPLHFACSWKDNLPLVKQLLARKDVDPNILRDLCHPLTLTQDLDIIKLFLARPDVDINFQAPNGNTALMCAIRANNPKRYRNASDDVIKFLLDQEGIDVNLRNNEGRTALSIAAHPNLLAGANLLLEREDVKMDLPDNDRRTPLFIACAERNLPLVDLFLKKKGVNPNAKDIRGCTPLAHVCGLDWDRIMNIEEFVELLLSHPDTDPCIVDNDGASILDKSLGNKSLPDEIRNTILGLLQAHPRYQRR
jgi:ankyrin repeat protein